MKIWKRGISLLLIVTLLTSVCPVRVQAADEEMQDGRVSVRTMKFSEKSGYKQDGTEEKIDVLVQNETLLVDVNWLCDKLHFVYDVRDGEQGFLWQTENAGSVHINGADMNIKDIPEMGKILAGYAKAFHNFSGGKELRIRKTYDSPIIFFLRTGSEQAYAYSRYMGDLNADLGANVVEKDGTIYVPFTMFLNLIDSYYCMDGDTIVLYPCQNTVVDILHSSNGLNERYSFDIAEDGGVGKFGYNLTSGYDNFYRKVKSLFQGTVNLDWETLKQAWPTDTTNESEALARQLCTNSKDDLDTLSTTGTLGADSLTVYNILASVIKDRHEEKAIEKWMKAEKEFADPLGSISLDEYVSAYWNTGKELGNSKPILTKIDDLENTSSNASNIFTIFAKYCMLTSEISSAQMTYVDSVQNYIRSYQKLKTTAMDAQMVDQIGEKTKLYSNKDVNPFKNADLMNELVQEVKNIAASTLAGNVTGEMLSKFAEKTLVQLQLVSIFWDAAEFVADELSGGAFSALDAIHGGTYAMLLEHDSNEIVNNCVNHATDLDEYRQLEWIRLRSYYITRQDLITFYQPEKKSMPDVYEVAMADVLQDCSELQKMMAVLSVGLTGVTQDALDKCEKANVENNATLVESVSIINNRELLEKLTDGYWQYLAAAEESVVKFKEDGTYYDISYSIADNGLYKTGEVNQQRGTFEIKGNDIILHEPDAEGNTESLTVHFSSVDKIENEEFKSYCEEFHYTGTILSGDTLLTPLNALQKSELKNAPAEPEYYAAYHQNVEDALSEYGDEYAWYYLYDLNGDGKKELFVQIGTSEANYQMRVYTISNGKSKYLDTIDFTHSALVTEDGQLYRVRGLRGTVEEIYKITMNGNTVSEEMKESNDQYTDFGESLDGAMLNDDSLLRNS